MSIMARRAGSTTENVHAHKMQIMALHSSGISSYTEIGRQTGCTRQYVKLVLTEFSAPTISPTTVIDWCIEYKREKRRASAYTILYYCKKHFKALYPNDNVAYPSTGKLEQRFREEHLIRKAIGTRKDKRP